MRFPRFFILLLFLPLLAPAQITLQTGYWRGTLSINDSVGLPFHFNLEKKNGITSITIRNGEEQIVCSNVVETDDSINWKMSPYDSFFLCVKDNDSSFHGYWFNHTTRTQVVMPFHAIAHRPRFDLAKQPPSRPYNGKWELTLNAGTPDSNTTLAQFTQAGAAAFGSIVGESGDYGYLEGAVAADGSLQLSMFNGAHAFLLQGHKKTDGTLEGLFWSQTRHLDHWTAKRNDAFQLPDPHTMVSMQDSTKIDFTYLDLKGRPVSLHDPKYKDKVVILQLIATWCPRCTEETVDLAALYKTYHSKGLEIIALAFERTVDPTTTRANVERMKTHNGAEYDFLLAGTSGKDNVADGFPFLKNFIAYPTTIVLDRKGKVVQVYSGYTGPSAGKAHDQLVNEQTALIKRLLGENP